MDSLVVALDIGTSSVRALASMRRAAKSGPKRKFPIRNGRYPMAASR